MNHLFVGFGQQTCRPIGPKCTICQCNDICPAGQKEIKEKAKKNSKSKIKIELDEEVSEEEQASLK